MCVCAHLCVGRGWSQPRSRGIGPPQQAPFSMPRPCCRMGALHPHGPVKSTSQVDIRRPDSNSDLRGGSRVCGRKALWTQERGGKPQPRVRGGRRTQAQNGRKEACSMTPHPRPLLPRETCLQGAVSGEGKESGRMSPQPLKAPGRRDPTPGSDDRPLRTLPAEGRGAGWSQPSVANSYQLPELDHVEDGIPGGRELGWETFAVCAVAQPRLTLRPRGLQPSRPLCPRDSPGKNAEVGCHFLL